MSLPFYIASRYFSSKKGYLFVSFLNLVAVCGVALGVFAMVVVLSVMTGFSKDLRDKLLGFNSHIRVIEHNQSETDINEFKRELLSLTGDGVILDVQKYVEGEVIIQQEGETSETAQGAKVRGINVSDLNKMPTVQFSPEVLEEGDDIFVKKSNGLPGIIVGSEILMFLGIQPGFDDLLRLTAPFGNVDPSGNLAPNIKLYRLAGGFISGYYDYDAKYVLMSLIDAKHLLGVQGRSGFFVWLKNPGNAEKIAMKLQKGLGNKYDIKSWSDENKKLFRALKLERIGMFILLMMIILIASFSVVSVVLMLVFSKRQDIGMLQALGLDRLGIEKIFVYKGLMIGVLGTLIGLILGVAVCLFLKSYKIPLPSSYYLDYLPVKIHGWHVLVTSLAGIFMALVAAVYPARQAMQVKTTAVLRYE